MSLLKGGFIQLRALEPEDLNFMQDVENNTENWKYGDTVQPFSKYILKEYIKVAEKPISESGQLRLLITDEEDHERLGFIDLYEMELMHSRAGVAIIVHPDHQRQGFALEALRMIEEYAFRILDLHQLYASILEENDPSIKLFEKAGFVCSGKKKAWRCIQHQYKDELFYQKLRT